MSEEKLKKLEQIEEFNRITRERNRVLLSYTSSSHIRHPFAWGTDQQKLLMRPSSYQSHERSHTKKEIDPEKRREELGLGYLNKLDEETKQKLFRSNNQ